MWFFRKKKFVVERPLVSQKELEEQFKHNVSPLTRNHLPPVLRLALKDLGVKEECVSMDAIKKELEVLKIYKSKYSMTPKEFILFIEFCEDNWHGVLLHTSGSSFYYSEGFLRDFNSVFLTVLKARGWIYEN